MARKQPESQVMTAEEVEQMNSVIAAYEQQEEEKFNAPTIADEFGDAYADAWANYATGASGEFSISVCRDADAHRGKETKLFSCRSSDYTPDELENHIQRVYGGGDYRIRGYLNGKILKGLNKQFSCESLPEPANQVRAPEAQTFESRHQSNLMDQQLQMSNSMMNMQMQMMQGMAALFASIARPEKGPDILEMMRVVKELLPPPPAQNSDSITMLKEGIALARELAGTGGGESEESAMSIIQNLIKTAGPMLTQAMSQPRQPQIQQRPQQTYSQIPVPAPRPIPAPPTRPPVPDQLPAPAAVPEKQDAKKDLLDALAQFIATGANPQESVDFINSHLTDDEFDQVIDYFQNPGWLAELVRFDKRFEGHEEWLGFACTCFMSYLDDGSETGDTGTEFADSSALETDGNQNPPHTTD